MLVKFECGCIGFPPDEKRKAWIVVGCDNDGHSPLISLFLREIDKSFAPISREDEAIIFRTISELIRDGHSFQEIRHAFLEVFLETKGKPQL